MTKEKFKTISLHQEMQRSYLEYAMSVIVGRALPDARDGLKPVQRRILFAMHELGLTPERPFRKCARVVGDVLGKYHPHGDQAVYDALVRLVQNFSTKYPTLDGHGNFGSVDDDPPAAMRYTETRLAPIANEALLQEIDSKTVSFSDNFDGSQKEPDVLPAQLPFLLLNGSSGIAVGMATNIPPHNLGEIIDALILLTKDNNIDENKLNNIVLGPDFPTGGEIIYTDSIKEFYEKGRGSITMRGVIHPEELNLGKGKHKRNALVITELPYQISKAGWIEKLADLVNNNKINGIADIRDESDRDGMRIIIEVKRDINQELLISELHKKTTLQTNFGAIFLAIVNGKPIQLSLKEYLNHFLKFREATIRKRTEYYLSITIEKLEILEGFSIAVKNIKKIIEIVQNSKDVSEAKFTLCEYLNLQEKQADAVLSMPIKKLTALERNQINKNIEELNEKKKSLQKILNQRDILLSNLIEELKTLKKKYNKKRKTKIIKNLNQQGNEKLIQKQIIKDFIDKEMKIIIDNKFYLKKIQINNYRKFIELNNGYLNNKNNFIFSCEMSEYLKIFAFTTSGKIININWQSIIKNDCKLDNKLLNNTNPSEILNFHHFKNNQQNFLCLLTEDGRFKKITINNEMINTNRIFSIIKQKKENKIINSFISNENEFLIVITSIGRIFKFSLSNSYIIPASKQSQGSNLIKLLPQEKIIFGCNCKEDEFIIIASKKGKFFKININEISNSHIYKMGYLNEKIKLKNDTYIKIFSNSQYCVLETNKGKIAKINPKTIAIKNKYLFDTDFLQIQEDENVKTISCLDYL
tara:strand:- start:327 stop:2759 length:2433 start_codon:yes stop_codon:yes gene_type:complete